MSTRLFGPVLVTFPEHYPCDHTRGLSLRCFTLKESIRMYRGAAPPLDFVTRILKYWMLEADKWVDVLIICRWTNLTTFTICSICGNEPKNTSCGHTFCTDCLHEKFKNRCRNCPSCQTVVEAKVYHNDSAKVLLIRYREERHASIPGIGLYYIIPYNWKIWHHLNRLGVFNLVRRGYYSKDVVIVVTGPRKTTLMEQTN